MGSASLLTICSLLSSSPEVLAQRLQIGSGFGIGLSSACGNLQEKGRFRIAASPSSAAVRDGLTQSSPSELQLLQPRFNLGPLGNREKYFSAVNHLVQTESSSCFHAESYRDLIFCDGCSGYCITKIPHSGAAGFIHSSSTYK